VDIQTFGPYSPMYQAGDLYFISGQVGVNPETKKASKDVKEQTAQALMNMSAVLASEGLEMRDVVKTTIYVTDMGDFAGINDVYAGYFDAPRPARATVAVRELPRLGGNVPIVVEIEAVATKTQGEQLSLFLTPSLPPKPRSNLSSLAMSKVPRTLPTATLVPVANQVWCWLPVAPVLAIR